MDVDAAEVLAYLQSLGYHDIEPDQFRLFLKDLRKLIRSEERKRLAAAEQQLRNSEALTLASTVSFDAKKKHSHSPKYLPVVKIDVARRPVLQPQSVPNTTTVQSLPPSQPPAQRPPLTRKSNLIKPIRRPELTKKSDPVALYHFYETIWKRTKIPGESDHSELRWQIRERLSHDNYYDAATATATATTSLSPETIKRVRKSAVSKTTARTIASMTKQQQLQHERFW